MPAEGISTEADPALIRSWDYDSLNIKGYAQRKDFLARPAWDMVRPPGQWLGSSGRYNISVMPVVSSLDLTR